MIQYYKQDNIIKEVSTLFKVAICDDDEKIISQVEGFLYDIEKMTSVEFDMDIVKDGSYLLKDFQKNKYHMIFLDIEMELMDGVETAEEIRKIDEDVLLIYMSSYDTYFQRLFKVRPFDFIKKPMEFEDFYKVFKNGYNYLSKSRFFLYNYNKDKYRIPYDDIYYFESDARVISIFGKNREKLGAFYDKMDNIESQLNNTQEPFIRIHKSYIVNFKKIKVLKAGEMKLLDDTDLGISKKYKNQVKDEFLELTEIYG